MGTQHARGSRFLRVRGAAAAVCLASSLLATALGANVRGAEALAREPEATVRAAAEERMPVELRFTRQEEETAAHGTQIIRDDTLYEDEGYVETPGTDGVLSGTWEYVFQDGVLVSRHLVEAHMEAYPVTEVVVEGTRPGSRTDSRGTYIWPTTGVVTSGFGRRHIEKGSSNHQGLDIGTPVGTEVRAADGGEVIYAQDSGKSGYGILVKLRHDDGTVTYYAHLNEILVEVGDRVAQGQLIARSGATGNVTGPHLHFEIRPNGGDPVDPAGLLEGELKRG